MNYLNKLKNKKESVLIIALPLLFIFSRFLLEFFLLLISISFIFKLIKNKNYYIFKNFFTYLFFGFYLILMLSFSLSEFKNETISIIFYFRFYFYIIALYYFFNEDKNLIYFFLTIIVVLIICLFIDSIFQYLMGYNLFGYKNAEIHRITSFFDDEQILGSFVLKLFPILLFAKIFFKNNSTKINYLVNLSILISPIIIFLSGERTGMYLFILIVFYYLIFLHKFKEFKFFYISAFIGIIVIIFSLINSKTYYDRYINQTLKGIFDSSYSQNKDMLPEDYKKKYNFFMISAIHQNFFETSIAIFKKNKFIGSGPKSYRYVCNNYINIYSCSTHPHNYYFQMISEVGIVGLIYLSILYLIILFKSLTNFFGIFINKNFKSIEIIILGYYFIQFWPITQSGNLFNNWNSIILFLPLSIFFALKNISNKKKYV